MNEFTGWFIPAYVVDLFEDGVLNVKEMLLLAVIGNLSMDKNGCISSNKCLGSVVHLSERKTSQAIAKLKSLKLLEVTKFDGRKRHMKVMIST